MGFNLGDLRNSNFVSATIKCGTEEDFHDLLGQSHADDASPDAEHVGVIVGAGHAGCIQVVAKRSADPMDLVGGQLLALTTATEHNAEIGFTVAHRAADVGANRRIVATLRTVRSEVGHVVTTSHQQLDEVLLELEACMVGANRDT